MEDKKTDSGFVIKDRRHTGDSTEEKSHEEIKTDATEKKADKEKSADGDVNYPQVNFTNFVLSLSTSALFHFGDFPDEEGGKAQKNLPAAKQTIDILDMLCDKTRGNLDKNENDLIQGVLYELKMRYVKEKV